MLERTIVVYGLWRKELFETSYHIDDVHGTLSWEMAISMMSSKKYLLVLISSSKLLYLSTLILGFENITIPLHVERFVEVHNLHEFSLLIDVARFGSELEVRGLYLHPKI